MLNEVRLSIFSATISVFFRLTALSCTDPQELVNTQELPSLLDSTFQKLKQVSEKYSSKSALGERPAAATDRVPGSAGNH